VASIQIKAYSPDKAYHICKHEARAQLGLIRSLYEDAGKARLHYLKIKTPCEKRNIHLPWGFDKCMSAVLGVASISVRDECLDQKKGEDQEAGKTACTAAIMSPSFGRVAARYYLSK